MNKICEKYVKMINDNTDGYVKSIVIYGSNIYGVTASDLDVCLITDNISKELKEKLINLTIKFHNDNQLMLDDEVPFSNKLVYTKRDINKVFNDSPFYKNGKTIINKIQKNKKFLSSCEMKKRLFINILTTDHITIGCSTEEYEKQAFKMIIKVVIDHFNLINPTVEELLMNLYENKYTGEKGEMFLGYKKNYKEKEKYLVEKLKEYICD